MKVKLIRKMKSRVTQMLSVTFCKSGKILIKPPVLFSISSLKASNKEPWLGPEV